MSETGKLLLGGIATLALLAAIGLVARLSAQPLETFVFYVFAALMVISALGVAFSRNIVRSAAWLLGALGAGAGLYLLLSANFLAMVQLIVYAGGILILIIFGIMLTARGPAMQYEPPRRELVLGGLVGAVLLAALVTLILNGLGDSGAPRPAPAADTVVLGRELLKTYLLPLQLIAVLLLAVMIGAAYLARPEKK